MKTKLILQGNGILTVFLLNIGLIAYSQNNAGQKMDHTFAVTKTESRMIEIRSYNLKQTGLLSKKKYMNNLESIKTDSAILSDLNAQFIKNFLTQDVKAHDKIIYRDFLCIQSSGAIVQRDEYLKDWATGYEKSGYTSFSYTDESIRIFGSMALVRSKTVYTKVVEGKTVTGNTIYTDTYVKENGEWKCVQAQLTAVKNN